MGTLTDVIAQAGQPDSREQAIIDRHKSGARKGSLFQDVAEGMAEIEIDTRRQQRAYAEKPTSEIGQIMAAPTKEMISSLGDRAKVLNTIRSLTPEQRQEALRLAPGIAQQLGDDRGGMVGRTLGAVSRGVSHGVSQPIMELAGQVAGNDFGGTAEEIAYIRELDKAASQEFSPARPGDPWYQSGPLQAAEMLPWMATVVGGGGAGRQAATEIAKRVTARAAAGSRVAGAVQAAGQAIGKVPQAVGAKVGLNSVPAIAAGKVGELAGITAAAFPGQYAQEVDSLKALGMVDDTKLRLLAGGTAAITGIVEGIVPNPFKTGNVSLTQGATKAARQYLWNAAKNAPGELTEEYLQGVTSGLGEHVAQYIGSEVEGVNPAKKKTIEDAFRKGWEQSKEAALPMAFLLGVPAVGGAGLAAARARQGTSVDGMPVEGTMLPGATQQPLPTGQENRDTVSQTTPPALPPTQPPELPPAQQAPAGRASQLEDVISKGFVSSEDATNFGIAGANRKERLANAKAELDGLKSSVTQEQAVPDQSSVESQYAEEVARRRAAKSGVKPPALPEQQPPVLPAQPNAVPPALPAQEPVRDTVSQNPPLPKPTEPITAGQAVSEFGSGLVDGLYSKVWNDAQSGSLEKMDKPPLFEQLVLKGHKAGVVQSVEDVKSISEGMTGDFEADKKIGIDNLNRLVAKYKEQSPTQAVEPVQDTVSKNTATPSNWVKYDDNSYGMKINVPDVGDAEATLSYNDDKVSLYVDTFGSSKDAPKGSGKKLLRTIVDNAKEYSPQTISGHFTNEAALGAFGSEFGQGNITFTNRRTGQDANVSFEDAIKAPADYIATADISADTSARNERFKQNAKKLKSEVENLNRLLAEQVAEEEGGKPQTEQPKNKGVKPVEPAAPEATVTTSEPQSESSSLFITPEWRVKREAEIAGVKRSSGMRNVEAAAKREVDEEIAAMQAYPDDTELTLPDYKGTLRVKNGQLIDPSKRVLGANAGAVLRGYKPEQIKVVSKTKVEVSPIVDSTPQAETPIASPPKKNKGKKKAEPPKAPQVSPQKQIGVNSLGQSVSEDENGVRSVLEGNIRISEKVELRPTRDRGYVPSVDVDAREDRFKTTDETKSRDTVSQNPKPEPENKDAPQPNEGGDPNEVEAKDGQQKQSNAEAETNAKAEAEGQVGAKGGQAAGATPSPDSSAYEWKKGSNGVEAKGLDGYIRLIPAKDQFAMDGAAQDEYWISAPTKDSTTPQMQAETRYKSLDEAKQKLVEANKKYGKSKGLAKPTVKDILAEEKKPLSEWEQGVADLLATVPAFKGSSFAMSKDQNTVKVTRPDGRTTTINFNADEQLDKLAKKNGMAFVYGAYNYREGSKSDGHIFLRSNGDAVTLNHEVVHWLEDEGIITAEEVEKYGGREGLAEAYGVWAANKSRPANTLFEKIYDFLDSIFNVNAKFFKELTERVDATKADMHYPDGSAYRNWMNRNHRIGDTPTSYLSGHSSAGVRDAAKKNPGLGLVITPANPGYVGHGGDYSHVMIDNGAFSEFTGTAPFSEDKFFALLDKVVAAGLKDKVQHVVVPDKVGDWKGTTERWKQFYERVRAYGMPLAYVGQDGIEQNTDQVPWDQFDVFFIGGSTPWKLGYDPKGEYKDFNRPTDAELAKAGYLKAQGELIKEAKRRGKRVHMGRVNSWKRMEVANYGAQVDSVDGNYIGAAPDKNLPVVIDWLKDTGGEQFKAGETAVPETSQDDAALKAMIEAEFDKQLGAEKTPAVEAKNPIEYKELKKNGLGVTRTVEASDGEKTLVLELNKHNDVWTISEKGKSGTIAIGIRNLKKAKEVSQRILDGTFDKEGDDRFVKSDSTSNAYSNTDLEERFDLSTRDAFATSMKKTGFYTDGRIVVRLSDKDRDDIWKKSKATETDRSVPIKPLLENGKKLFSYKSNESVPVAYRGGDIDDKQVLLKNGNGGFVLIDKALHDTIMQRHPTAKVWSDTERFKDSTTPVAYSVDGEIVGLVMPLKPKRIDKYLQAAMDGTYVFPAKPEVSPKPKKLIRKPKQDVAEPKTKLATAAEKARKEADELWEEYKKEGSGKLMANLDPKLASIAVKIAIAELKAEALSFAAFVERTVAKIPAAMLEKSKPYFEMAWSVAYERNMTSDPGGKFDDYLKEVNDGNQKKSGAETNATMEDGVGKPDGDGASVGDAANEGRDTQGDTGQESDPVLRDNDKTAKDNGRKGSGGISTDGNTDADQSEQGQPDAADTRAGDDAESVADKRAVNHVIGPEDDIAVSSLTKSLSRNVEALQLLKTLETEGRFPDEAERKALAQYTGWGGLSQALDSILGERMLKEQAWGRDENWEKKWGPAYIKLKDLLSKEEFKAAQDSTENAHYTSKTIIQSLWKIAERLGFNGGRVLELGAGIGHFAGLVPSNVRGQTKFVMVERDSVSSRIIKMLYPSHEVVAGDMEQFRAVPGSVTIGIGNVPFAGGTVADSATRYKEDLNLHNYSIARHLDAVAPGGVVVVISTHNTLDSNIKQRKLLASKGELIGAIRLPNDAFAENAKTEVVTDVLIFRRPRQGDGAVGVRFDQNAEIRVKNKTGQEVVKSINKYFIDNPDMVLGEHSAKGSLYGADEYTLNSTPGSLQSKLDAAIEKLPRDLLGRVDIAEKVVESDKSVPFGRLEIQGGKVVMGFGDKFVPIAGKKFEEFPVHLTGKTGVARAKDYIELRDLLTNVRNVMLSETATDDAVKRSQTQLSKSYDRYVNKHGPLNAGTKTNIFVRDPDFYRVLALENERSKYNAETKKIDITYEKASIFTERVLGPQKEPESAGSAADAMSISVAWRGAIDSVFVGKLLGISPKEAELKLIDDGLAFRNPSTTELELSDLYLSGNVRAKLEQAKLAAVDDPQYEKNVEALTKVMPPDVTIKKDTVRLGATWIPEHVINAFATQAFGTKVNVSYNANTDIWSVPDLHSISETAKAKYKTDRIQPDEVLSETLNLRSIKVYDRKETGEFDDKGRPKTTQVLNEKETQAAKHRASVLRADFEKWVLENADVSDALARIYNDKYNNFVRTKYNGEFLVLPGANPEVKLRPYQKDAIWRIINRGTALLAHAVGSGKTYTMIGAAMEMRRLGLARRPLLVVQNATLGQFATSFQKMYPNANVLVANKEDLGKGKRQLFLNKVSTGNWDAVVMAQSTFDNMASDPEVERAFIQDQLDLLEEAIREEGGEHEKTPTVKQLVRTKKSLKKRFDSLMGSRAKKEDNVTFEELGADALFLDEAHAYKKPTFTTKLSQLVGLNVEASARSLATTIKVRSVQSAHNGRNVVLATGTPVTNTLGEAWHMVNYVSPATNAAFSSRTFDQFIGNFAQVEPTLTMNAGGKYVYKDAIVKFRNGRQLVEYINDSWDIVTPDALRSYMTNSGSGFPSLRNGQPTAITVDRTPGVAAFMDYIARVYDRFKELPAKERRAMSFIPAIAYGASKAATLDIRMVVPGAKEEKNSKLQKAADEIKRIYDETSDVKGTQLFFSDMKNPFNMNRLKQFMGGESIDAFEEDDVDVDPDAEVDAVSDDNESGSFLYQEMKSKLIARGIPVEQIAFIADAKTDKQRQALFERVNNGDIRVLIGSTAKMGVGVNVQNKLAAIHHFDTPWLPADLEQREGRILRFGNENAVVEILRYAMKKTLDGAIYMGTSRKQKFIWQVLNGNLDGDSFEDPSSASMLSIEEQLAAIQDDPVFFEKIEIQNRLRELELERQSFFDAQRRVASSLSMAKSNLDYAVNTAIPAQENRLKRVEKYKNDGALDTFSMDYDGEKFTDEKKAAELIKGKVEELRKYVMKNFDDLQTIARSGGVLMLPSPQKISFKLGPANVVIGAGPAFITEEVDGKSVTRSTARIESLVYLSETSGGVFSKYEIYNGAATVPSTLIKRLEALLEEVQGELNRSLATAKHNQEKIKELEGLTGKEWEDQAEYDTKKARLSEIETEMLASSGSLRDAPPKTPEEKKLDDKIDDLPDTLYQTEDVDPSIRLQALDIAFAAEDAGIKSFDQLVAYSVKTVGDRRTREIGAYLHLAANAVGFEGVRPVGDVLGSPNVTKEQASEFAKAAFPMLSDEQIEAGVAILNRLGLLDKIGFAPFGSPTPEQDQKQKRGGNVKGWTSFISATRALIGATNKADISTFIHEFAHPMRRFLLNREIPQSQRADITDAELDKLEKAVGVENGEWKVENEEKFAKMWEQYWFDGKAPRNSGLEGFFDKIARWMQTVYKNIQQITGRQLPQEVRDLFDKLVRNGDEEIRDTVSQNENRDTVSQNGERDVTSIKNALMNEKRFLRGVRALDDVSKQTQDEWLEAAEALLQDDPMLGDQLVKEINTKARNLSNIEVAVLQIHYRGMNNRLEKVSDRLFAAKEAKDAAESAKALIDVDMVMNALVEIEEAAKAAGREWGRAGVARQIELEKDFSRVAVLRKARIANGGNALNEQQLADMDALAKRVAELEGDLAKAIQDKLDIERKKNVEAQIDDSKTKARSVPESIGKKAVDRFNAFKSKFASAFASSKKTDSLFATEDEQMVDEAKSVIQVYSDMGIFSLGEFLANIRKELGSDLPVSVQAAFTTAWNEMKNNGDIVTPMVDKNDVRGLSRLAKQIERSLVEAGVTKLDDVVRGVMESLQEIIPDITIRETMDAISGYGQYSAPSEDPNDKIIADINGRLLELAKLNDMENKIAPARTGVGRQEKSPEHRELIRKVNLAKREGKYRVTDPDTQLKSAVGSALTALTNRIYDLNKAINVTKQPIVSATKEDLAAQDARVVKLRKERDELAAIYKTMFPKPGATMEQRIATTDRALERVIADLEKQVQSGNFTTSKKSEPISTKELDAKRARIDELRAQREAIVGVKKKTDEQLAKAYKANLLKQIADYKDKSLHSYFAPKPKKETRTLNSEELRLMKELQDVKDDFFKRAGLYRLENMSPRERAWDYVKETAHLSRALMTSLDFSAVFRQGGAIAFAHPMMAASTSKDMYKAMWSDAAAFEMAAKIRIDEMYQFAMTAGLSITEEEGKITKQEEAYMGRWARLGLGAPGSALNTISKGLLTPVSSSARGYMTFLNGIRFNLFKNMVANLGKGGQVTADEAKVIAMYINAATGRSELGPMMKWAEQANMLFFAPRFVASRFQYLGMPLWLLGSKKVSGRVKKAIAMEYIRHSASVGTFLAVTVALGSLLGDDDEEKPTVSLDPRSSDFLKIKLGETRIDPMSGLSQVITLLGRIASGQRVGADGKVIDLRGEDAPYGGLGVAGTVGNFVRTKFAPIPGAAFDVATGENVVGQPVTPFSSLVNLFYPLSLREIQDTAQSRGIPQGALIALVSLHGMGASTYGPESNYRKGTDEQKKKQFDKGIKKMTFDSPDPAYKEMLSKEQLSEVSERREERKQGLVFSASANPIRKEYRSDESYKTAVAERDASLENLKKSGMSLDESRKLLIKHWETSYGSAKEVRKGVRVYKEALSDRLRQLRKVFSE